MRRMASTASWWMKPAGCEPALRTSKASGARWRRIASAICERHELPVHRKRMRGRGFMGHSSREGERFVNSGKVGENLKPKA